MLAQIINSNKVQENTRNATSQHANSTYSNWCTFKHMLSFTHSCKYFSEPKIRIVKQVINIMYEKTSSPYTEVRT